MLVTVRVRPGASRTAVGGRYGDDALIVRTQAPAVDGRANDAVIRAVAAAFGIPTSAVRLRSGRTARTKVLDVEVDEAVGTSRLAVLLDAGAHEK